MTTSEIVIVSLSIIAVVLVVCITIISIRSLSDQNQRHAPLENSTEEFSTLEKFDPKTEDHTDHDEGEKKIMGVAVHRDHNWTPEEPPATSSEQAFDRQLLVAVEEGISSLEKDSVEAASRGDVDFIKKAFSDLDWMEDLRDRISDTLDDSFV